MAKIKHIFFNAFYSLNNIKTDSRIPGKSPPGRSSTAAFRFTHICGPESRTFKQLNLDYSNYSIQRGALFYFSLRMFFLTESRVLREKNTALIHKMVSVFRLSGLFVLKKEKDWCYWFGHFLACPRAQARSCGYLCLRPAWIRKRPRFLERSWLRRHTSQREKRWGG